MGLLGLKFDSALSTLSVLAGALQPFAQLVLNIHIRP